jgi:hypothetical protein
MPSMVASARRRDGVEAVTVSTGSIKNAYLSGWEFNRLLERDPLASQPSSLPADVLWKGSSFLWLFEAVYCTKESLEGERRSAGELGWTSGKIYQELESLGILRPVDWNSSDLSNATKDVLRIRHRSLRERFSSEDLRGLVRSGAATDLEAIKLELMQPIHDVLHCLSIGSPSSLPNWVKPANVPPVADMANVTREALDLVVAPLQVASRSPGLAVCRPPGTGVSQARRREQAAVVRDVESPLMPDMLLREGVFDGSDGYEPYIEAVSPHRHLYRPINEQLAADWKMNLPQLLELRRLARKYLWPSLHEEWLPRLEAEGAAFTGEFERLLAAAMRESRFAGLLNYQTDLIVGITTLAATSLGLAAHTYAGLPEALAVPLAGAAGMVASHQVKSAAETRGPIRYFYQRAIHLLRRSRGR